MLPRIGIVHIVVLWDYVDLWRDGIHSSFDQEKLTKLRVLNYGQVPILTSAVQGHSQPSVCNSIHIIN